jgi:hypothetical protein
VPRKSRFAFSFGEALATLQGAGFHYALKPFAGGAYAGCSFSRIYQAAMECDL